LNPFLEILVWDHGNQIMRRISDGSIVQVEGIKVTRINMRDYDNVDLAAKFKASPSAIGYIPKHISGPYYWIQYYRKKQP